MKMKLKIITLFLLFFFNSISSFAVIDTKKRVQSEQVQNFPKENFSQKKKIKKRKFRLRDLFQWKKKIKKARKKEKKEISNFAIGSLACAILGTIAFIFYVSNLSFYIYVFLLFEISAFVLGKIALSKIKKEPEKLRGEIMARIGVIIPVLWALIIIGLFLWIFFTADF